MVLPHENIFPMLQPNLGFQDDKEEIISSLNTFFWRYRRNTTGMLARYWKKKKEEWNL